MIQDMIQNLIQGNQQRFQQVQPRAPVAAAPVVPAAIAPAAQAPALLAPPAPAAQAQGQGGGDGNKMIMQMIAKMFAGG